jgi:hypothetical protein
MKIICSLFAGFISLSVVAQNNIVIPDDPFKGMTYVDPVFRKAVEKDKAARVVANHSTFLRANGESIILVNETVAIYGVQPNYTPMVTISYIDKPIHRAVTSPPRYYYHNGQWYLYR